MITLAQEMTINFIIGGATLGVITYLVKYLKPEIGAIVWAAPVILVPTILALWLNNTETIRIANFVGSAIPNVLLIVLWQVTFIVLLVKFKMGVIKSVFYSLIAWIIIATLLYKSGLYNYFKISIA